MQFCAAHQPFLQRVGALAARIIGYRVQQCQIIAAFGLLQHFGQHLPHQLLTLAVLHRAGTRHQACLLREVGEQPLRESVNRIDPKPATGTIKHAGKQGAGFRLRCWAYVCSQMAQLFGQLWPIQPDPAGQYIIDPHRHFGRACLGKG